MIDLASSVLHRLGPRVICRLIVIRPVVRVGRKCMCMSVYTLGVIPSRYKTNDDEEEKESIQSRGMQSSPPLTHFLGTVNCRE